MKKILLLILVIVMCLSLVACGKTDNKPTLTPGYQGGMTNNETDGIPSVDKAKVLKEGSCGNGTTFKLHDNGVLVISGTGSVAEENPFGTYGDYLKYIRIDEGVTDIEDGAFYNIDSFSIVELPSTLKTIGDFAFGQCFGLKSINFPEGLESIGKSAFYITNLQSIVLPSTITKIAEGAFSHNDSLETIIIPGNIKIIRKGAFQSCDKLTTIIFCEGVETIEEKAFDSNGLRKMAIPNSVISIGEDNIDYRTEIYCNDGAAAIDFAKLCYCDVDTITGYDGFVKNYDIP